MAGRPRDSFFFAKTLDLCASVCRGVFFALRLFPLRILPHRFKYPCVACKESRDCLFNGVSVFHGLVSVREGRYLPLPSLTPR